jgi:transcriptional regulator
MRHSPPHAVTDAAFVRQLIAENPWSTIISSHEGGIVASHYPVLLDQESEELALFTHVGRPDDQLHQLGANEVMVIIAGPHGYISPSWYAPGAVRAPTWNFTVAHCYGVPQILSLEQNITVLTRLQAHFEQHVEEPIWLEPDTAARLAPGTVGMRIPITRFVCKRKLSRDKDPVSQRQVIEHLNQPGPYSNPLLAAAMKAAQDQP